MSSSIMAQIEDSFVQLSRGDQFLVLERLVHRLRETAPSGQDERDSQLAAMAADPDVQRELRLIEAEFAGTEADGLEGL